MLADDRRYFERRAERELELAQRATKPEVVKIHVTLAEAYLERVMSSETAEVRQPE